MDLAEVAIIKAAFAVISTDTGMLARFGVIRLTEGLPQLTAFGIGTLVVAGFPAPPKDYPSQRENIFVDLHLLPVLQYEATGADSVLLANTLLNEFRVLLNANLPLLDPDDPSRHVTDAVLDLDWRRTLYPAGAAVRIPNFVARYTAHVNVLTGDFAV